VKRRRVVCSRFTDISEEFQCALNTLASYTPQKTMITVQAARAVKILRHRPVFRRVRKIAKSDYITFVMSILLSAPNGRIFMKSWYGVFFEKFVARIQVSLKSDTNNWYFT
jgi:hypothetical protein